MTIIATATQALRHSDAEYLQRQRGPGVGLCPHLHLLAVPRHQHLAHGALHDLQGAVLHLHAQVMSEHYNAVDDRFGAFHDKEPLETFQEEDKKCCDLKFKQIVNSFFVRIT